MINALFMLKIVAAVVTEGILPECPQDINWEKVLKLSSMHNITNIVAYGISKGKYDVPEEVLAKFKKSLLMQLTIRENQHIEIRKI